jgi:hypothetical protein
LANAGERRRYSPDHPARSENETWLRDALASATT